MNFKQFPFFIIISGYISAAVRREAVSVTLDSLENLHHSLKSCPGESEKEPTPSCLTVPFADWFQRRVARLSKTVKIKRSTGTLVVCPASVVGMKINITYLHTEQQIADILAKALAVPRFEKLRNALGVILVPT